MGGPETRHVVEAGPEGTLAHVVLGVLAIVWQRDEEEKTKNARLECAERIGMLTTTRSHTAPQPCAHGDPHAHPHRSKRSCDQPLADRRSFLHL